MKTHPILKSAWKASFLFLLSTCQTINYINHIPYLLFYLPKIKYTDVNDSIYIILCFITYDIIKYITKIITAKFAKIIGQQKYYMISLLDLSVITGLFYIVTISVDNIFIYTFYRCLISMFNNISAFINIPISALYKPSENLHMLEIYSFMEKLSVFIFFFFIAKFYRFFSLFNNFYLISTILNSINFIFYLFLYKFYKGFKNLSKNKYFQEISEVPVINPNNIDKTLNKNNKKSEIDCQTINTNTNLNLNTNSNNIINPIDLEKDKIFILSNSMPGNSPNDSLNSQTLRNKKIKDIFVLNRKGITKAEYTLYKSSVVLYSAIKVINYFSLFMLIMKSFKINQEAEQNVVFEIPKIHLSFKFETKSEAILFLFMFYYLIMIFAYLLNKIFTTAIIKIKYMNYLLYYFAVVVLALSGFCFIYYYFDNNFGFKFNIVTIFLYEFLISECSMIILIIYNIKLANKKLTKNAIKNMKSMGFFFAGLIFLLSYLSRSICVNVFGKTLPDELIYYLIFITCVVIVVIVDCFLK